MKKKLNTKTATSVASSTKMKKAAAPAGKTPKKVKKKPSAGLINTAMRLYLSGPVFDSAIKLSDYTVGIGSKYKVESGAVKTVFGFIKNGAQEFNEDAFGDLPKGMAPKLEKVFNVVKKDFDIHVKNKAQWEKDSEAAKVKAKEEKEAEKEKKDKRRQLAVVAMDASITKTAKVLANVRESVDKTIKAFIPKDKFKEDKNGLLVPIKGTTLTEDDFRNAFAGFVNLNLMQDEYRDAAAEREAQLALHYKKGFPETWEEPFINRPKDLDRIKKGVKLYETLNKLDVAPFNTVSNMRKATEVLVFKGDEEKNLEAKRTVVGEVLAFQENNDRRATQGEISEIVTSVKNRLKGTAEYVKPKAIFMILMEDGSVDIVSGPVNDPALLASMSYGINMASGKVMKVVHDKKTGKEKVIEIEIKPPTKSQSEYIKALIDAKEDEADEDEDEEDEDEVPVKKATKKVAPPPADEDEDEEEEEEEEEDADEEGEEEEEDTEDEDEEEEEEESEDEDEEEEEEEESDEEETEEEETEDEEEDEEVEEEEEEDEDEEEEEEDEDEEEEEAPAPKKKPRK